MTGCQIYYQTEVDQGSVDVGASATQHTLTGLRGGRNYSIYLAALSAQLPSPVVGPAVVTLGGELACYITMLAVLYDPYVILNVCVTACDSAQLHVIELHGSKIATLQCCISLPALTNLRDC